MKYTIQAIALLFSLLTHPVLQGQALIQRNDLPAHWIELKKTKANYIIYSPCDGQTAQIKFYKNKLIFVNQIESPDSLVIYNITKRKDSTFHIRCMDKDGQASDIVFRWLNKLSGIALWKFQRNNQVNQMLMCPVNKKKNFKRINNPCPTNKIHEKQFQDTDNLN